MRRKLPIIAACVTLSGGAGLIYEVVWSRYLGLIIGSSTIAHTVVLGVFMGGLALGSAVFGRFADRTQQPLRAYAIIEVAIGLWAIGFMGLWPVLTQSYLAAGRSLGTSSSGLFAAKIILGVLVLLPPTTLMGGTLPLLGRFVIDAPSRIGPRIAQLYFLNTAGAVLGCAAAGFWLIEGFGLAGSLWIACAINLIVGAITFALGYEGQHATEPQVPPPNIDALIDARTRRVVIVCIGITGGLTMAYELVWIRMVGFIFGSSSQSFSVMLVTFLGGIALGGLLAHRILTRWPRGLVAAFGICEAGIAISVLCALPLYERFPYVFAQARTLFAPTDGGYAAFMVVQVFLLGAVMLVPTTLIGVTLPLAARIAIRSMDEVGSGVGDAWASNTLGTLVGVTATGLVLIPELGVQTSLLATVAASSACAGLLLWVDRRPRIAALAVGACAVGLCIVILGGGAWDPVLMTAGYFRGKKAPKSFGAMQARFAGHKLLYAQDGHDATVTVVEVDDSIFLKVNGKTDASTLREDMVTQQISGHLPVLLHPGRATRVLNIGLGSGVTAGASLRYPEIDVVSVELSGAVVEGARHFAPYNHNVLEHPRHTLQIADAKDFIHLTRERFDVIINEPSNPWISGVASLFTAEYFRAVKDVLTEDGVYVQWLQLYAFSDEAFSRSVRTLQSVFPYVTVWRFTRADCLMVASLKPLQTEHLESRFAVVREHFTPESPLPLAHASDLLLHQVLSHEAVMSAFGSRPPLNLDREPFLEFEAPRAMFRRKAPKVLDDLDERRDPGAARRLLYARSVPAAPDHIADVLERAGQMSLAEHVRTSGALDAAPSAQDLVQAHATGDPVPTLQNAIERASTPSAEQCRAWTGRLAALAIHSRNALHQPPLKRLEQFVGRCTTLHPVIAPALNEYLAKARYATGHLDTLRHQ